MQYRHLLLLYGAMLGTGAWAQADSARWRGLTLGGYGEAVYSHNFYSDSYLRYTDAASKKDAPGHARFDLPHVCFQLGYRFGNGWSLGSEVEFEHGGTESAVEIETEEAGEYESEVERGGEVCLEQFWLQKTFSRRFNLRLGHQIVPVGATNAHHQPNEFFGVYRPEGENTILPCTWHETGVSVFGHALPWLRYEVMLLPGLDSERFGSQGWIHDGAGSPYEFKIGNALATAMRLDFALPRWGLRVSLSGYVGNSLHNTLHPVAGSKYDGHHGTVSIGALDFEGRWLDGALVVRGQADYGHLSSADKITAINRNMSKNSPSKHQSVASDAFALGVEAGYDVFCHATQLHDRGERLFVFGRYEAYDAMHRMAAGAVANAWCGRQRWAAGINYYPVREVGIKAEYARGVLRPQFNDEPSLSVGVVYAGLFR